jgi:outer membrane protein TolC
MLFTVRSQVNDAFFTVVTLQERDRMLAATVADLEAQLTDAKARVQAGTALPSTVAAIRAAILQHEQERQTVAANRDAAISTLESLTGQALDPRATFALPDLTAAVTAARGRLEHIRERPEYTQFARARDLLKVQGDVITSQDKPRVSLFGRAGYGRPGLNMLSTQFDSYWLGGIEVQWSPWTWGTTRRQREALVLQQQIVDADAAAFTENVQRSATRDLITIDRLVATMAADSDIVTLREQIEQTARAQLHEGVITASEYVGRSTDVLIARLARSAHKVELVEAQVRFLTTLGLEVR